jgi:CrcB protein
MGHVRMLVGSALGGMARYGVSGALARRIGETFPWGMLVVNVSGSYVLASFAFCLAAAWAGFVLGGFFRGG